MDGDMAGTIYTVAQQKGGAGKTTLAAHLAIAWTQLGYVVATVDIDPQGSLTRWHEVRSEAMGGKPGFHHIQIKGWRTQGEVEKLIRDFEVVVVDSPPHAQTEARIAVRAARMVIVPVQPSPMDLWAVQPTIDLARQEKRALMLVLNRVPPRARVADELVEKVKALASPPDILLADTQIGNRTAYAGTLLTGRSVTEAPRKTLAGTEMQALAAEILQRAGQKAKG
jgi:chromosome partitioning protein